MDQRAQLTEFGERYGLSDAGMHERLYTGQWKLVRPMAPDELMRVRRACELLPERAAHLLALLDPGRRTIEDPAERWAQQLIREAETLREPPREPPP
jgi:hypothetical protein